jgi:hypothetical protein
MASVSRKGDDVFSPDGAGKNCAKPVITQVDQVNTRNVYVNGILVPVIGNAVKQHKKRGCKIDDLSPLSQASSTVFIGGMGIGRVGDRYSDNVIIEGSPNVFAG